MPRADFVETEGTVVRMRGHGFYTVALACDQSAGLISSTTRSSWITRMWFFDIRPDILARISCPLASATV